MPIYQIYPGTISKISSLLRENKKKLSLFLGSWYCASIRGPGSNRSNLSFYRSSRGED